MSYWNDFLRRKLLLRDHSNSTRLDERAGVQVGYRVEREESQTQGTVEAVVYLECGFYLQGGAPKEDGKSWGGGFFAAGGEATKDGFKPYLNASQQLDDRYKAVRVSGQRYVACKSGISSSTTPAPTRSLLKDVISANNVGAQMPLGQPGVLLAGTREIEQHLNFFPAWNGVLASDDKGLKRSSLVADIDAGAINESRIGALHSIIRVSPSWDGHCTPAIYLAQRPEEKDLGGMFYSHGRGGSTGPVLGYLGTDFFGPISGGTDGGDKHNIGVNADTHACNQGHIDGLAPIYLDARRDAPFYFDPEDYELDQDWGVFTKCYRRYNPERLHQSFANGAVEGAFENQARVTWFVIQPKKKKDGSKKKQPKKKPPRIPGDGRPQPGVIDPLNPPGGVPFPPTPQPLPPTPTPDPGAPGVTIPVPEILPPTPIPGFGPNPVFPGPDVIIPIPSDPDPLPEPEQFNPEPIIILPTPSDSEPFQFSPKPEGRVRLGDFAELEKSLGIDQDRENRKRLCLYNFSWMETVSPASMGQPTPIHRPDEDLRNVGTPPREFIEEVYLTRPFSYREEFFGSYDESGNPTYAEDAGDDDGQHKPGTFLFGGKHIMPPGISLDHIKSERTGDKNLSEVAVSHHSDYTFTVYGEPIFSDDPDVSGKWKGFGTIRNSTTDRLETYHAPATGVRTLISEIDSRGRDRKLCIGTYGDGDDGDVTTAGPFTNLSAVKYYENLTIDTADAMNARSLPVFVKDTLTISAGGYFHTFVEGGAGGDEGGAGASGASERWYGASGAGGEGGQSGGSGAAGTSAGPSLGGSGGSGGAGTSGSAGAAGSATAPSYFPRFLEALLHGQDRDLSGYQGGAGGGGGGGGAGSDAGGGGSGGGVMVIVARHLVLDTSGGALFRSLGSNGGAGFNDGSGGGGGGGGGFVCLVYQTAEDQDGNPLSESDLLELIDVSGGSGGAGQGSGGNGADGTGGNKMVICHG